MRAVERALGAGDVGADDGGAQVLEPDAVGGEPREIGLDADRRADAALHRDVADAGHFGQPLAPCIVSAMSLSVRRSIVSEVSASVTIGASAGFTLE